MGRLFGRSEIGSLMDKFCLEMPDKLQKPCWGLLGRCLHREPEIHQANNFIQPNRILSPILGLPYSENYDNNHFNPLPPYGHTPPTSRPLEKSAAQSLNGKFQVENLSRFTSLGLSWRRKIYLRPSLTIPGILQFEMRFFISPPLMLHFLCF